MSQCNGPEAGAPLVYFRNSRTLGEFKTKYAVGDEVREAIVRVGRWLVRIKRVVPERLWPGTWPGSGC